MHRVDREGGIGFVSSLLLQFSQEKRKKNHKLGVRMREEVLEV